MGQISQLTRDEIVETIAASNRQSAGKSQRYVIHESAVIRSDYDFVACDCPPICWCRKHACAGHFVLKAITFEHFLDSYALLWLPPQARNGVKSAVLEGTPFDGRPRNSVAFLRELRENWPGRLSQARAYRKTGLCDGGVPEGIGVSNLYEAKIWSQLFYDSLIPFDTAARGRMVRAGYTNPLAYYSRTNQEMFADLRTLAHDLNLDLPGIRALDTPWNDVPGLAVLPYGQPLSRILDKIFYKP